MAWSKSFGRYGCRVRVFEAENGRLYAEERVTGKRPKRHSLKHRDRDRAAKWAEDEQAKLKLGLAVLEDEKPTAARIFTAYLEGPATRRTNNNTRKNDERCAEMWQIVLGVDKDLSTLTHEELDQFLAKRVSGHINAHGSPVLLVERRRPVRVRAVASDLEWLRAALRWARLKSKLMRENPMEGYAIPREKNPLRPVASQDRYEKLRAVASEVHPMFLDILEVANGTGRRLSAVLQLTYADLRLGEPPHGAICWPARTDKQKKEWAAPLNRATRDAIDRILAARPGIGVAPLFPSLNDRSRSLSRHVAQDWIRKAEKLAKVEHMPRGGYHAYRRKWGTERKHLPVQDVAKAGGWTSVETLSKIYQQPDPVTLYRVVSEPAELRERAGNL
jgi:site-specific recombinase XerD